MIAAHELVERILAAADFDDCMVLVTDSTQVNLRWANSTLTTNGMIAERKVDVIAFLQLADGMAAGVASRANVDLADIPALLAAAAEAARAAGPADDAAELLRDVAAGDWQAPHTATGPEVFAKIAPAMGDVFRSSVALDIELFGYAEHSLATTWLGSKAGLRIRFDQPNGRLEQTGKSHQRSRSTYENRYTRDFADVDAHQVFSDIRTKLDWQARRVDVPAGRYDTILPPGAVGDLLVYLVWSADARSAFEGRSAFAQPGGGTKVGEIIANLPINVYSDSAFKGLESAPYYATGASSELSSVFDNGQRLGRIDLVEAGKLTGLVQTRATAKLTGLPYTPLGDNLVVELPSASGGVTELVKGMDDGLLLNTLWYIRMVDPASLLLTGLTRDGVYKVTGGEVVAAVNNFRWNESPLGLLQRITAAGATEITVSREWGEYAQRLAMPALRLDGFNMSTVSQAN